MRKRHNRIFSVILAAALALTMLPPLAFAEDDPQGTIPAQDSAAQLEQSPEQGSAFGLLPDAGDDKAQEEPESAQDEPAESGEPTEQAEPALVDGPTPERGDAPADAPEADDTTEGTAQAEADPSSLASLADSAEPAAEDTATDEAGSLSTLADGTPIDAANFPDATFRAYVEDNFDTNEDGALSDTEAAAVTEISVSGQGITSLQGIGHFPALVTLYCGENQLTSLDVSQNLALADLYCFSNQLTSLDVSENHALEFLGCYSNQLTSLNLSQNPALQTLYCMSNQLTSLNLSQNPALAALSCAGNQLTSLDVSQNPVLRFLSCFSSQLTSLNVGQNPNLAILECHDNQLISLDISGATALESFFCGGNRLLNVTGLQAGLEGFYGSGQTATVPVSPDQLNPGSYLSDAAYSFGTHAITLDGTTAGFDAVAGRFATTSLDTPIGFETDDGTGQKVTGTVTFTLSPPQVSDSKDITSFVLAGKVGTISGTAITVTLPYGTGVGALTPEVAHTGASISPTGPQDFASPVAYTVTAEDETTRVYTVTVTVDTSVPVISAPDTWAGEGDAVARLDASYEDFVRLVLDGREVGPSNYTAGAGSTVITLHEGYLATLADGDYTFTAVFTNGTADIPVKVGTQASGGGGTGGGGSTTDGSGGGGSTTGGGSGGDAGTLPATGDAASLGLMALAVLLAAAGAGLVARRGQPQRGSIYRSGTRQGR